MRRPGRLSRCCRAVTTCCAHEARPACPAPETPDALAGWVDRALAIDIGRARWLEAQGYQVRTQTIPEAITPKNRLLIGVPRGHGRQSRRGRQSRAGQMQLTLDRSELRQEPGRPRACSRPAHGRAPGVGGDLRPPPPGAPLRASPAGRWEPEGDDPAGRIAEGRGAIREEQGRLDRARAVPAVRATGGGGWSDGSRILLRGEEAMLRVDRAAGVGAARRRGDSASGRRGVRACGGWSRQRLRRLAERELPAAAHGTGGGGGPPGRRGSRCATRAAAGDRARRPAASPSTGA